jgi:hypothetical protein
MLQALWLPVVAVVLLAAAAYFWKPRRKTSPAFRLAQARRGFHIQRERLEAKFVQLAAAHAKPDAPRWADCNFADDVSYVRNRATGELSAFVAVTIADDEFEGSFGASSERVGNLQAGTAVFRFDHDHWVTDGRAILNLSPGEAIRQYKAEIEIVSEEPAHRG